MLKRHSQLFEGLFSASDLVVVSAAWTLSYWIRFASGYLPAEKGIPPFVDYVRMLIFVWPIWAYVFRRFGLYRPMRGVGRIREIWTLVRANAFCVMVLLAVTYLFREKDVPFSRLVFLIFWILATIFTIALRSVIRSSLRHMRRKGFNMRYVLIVGSGKLAEQVAARLRAHPEYGLEVVGCLTNMRKGAAVAEKRVLFRNGICVNAGPRAVTAEDYSGNGANGRGPVPWAGSEEVTMDILGDYQDLPRILDEGGIDQVIIAMPFADQDRMTSVISSVSDAMVDVKIVPDFHRFIQLGSYVEELDGLPVVSIASTPLVGINRLKKRLFDIAVASLALVFALPIILFFALLVRLTSKGPVFYVQERVGLDGRRFRIYKLRTMYETAEAQGARFAIKDDPRVMPIGRFMRRYNIDELPQLFNVIMGHMSIVGPRPERPVFIEEFRQHFPRYMLRHKVQAGMTGWAQVNGWRGNTSIERRIEHDLYYIENWSLRLDMRIIGLTFLNSFRDRNAY